MVNMLKRVLVHIGINPQRLLLEWVSAAEGPRFAEVVTTFTGQMRELGPLSSDGEGKPGDLKLKLKAAREMVSGEKLRWVSAKQTEFKKDGNKYQEVFTSHEIGRYLDGVILEEIIIHQILLLLKEGPLSIKDISQKLQITPPRIFEQVLGLKRKGIVEVSTIKERSPIYTISGKVA